MEAGKVYFLSDLYRGKQRAIEPTGLRLGQVVSYEDRANPRQTAVVVEAVGGNYGQKVIYTDTFHVSSVSKAHLDGLGGWEYTNEPDYTPEQIADLFRKSEQAKIDRANARDVAAAKFANETKKLIAAHPELTPVSSELRGHVLAAKNIRVELKRAFPGVKFSVRGKSYSGGNSIDVSWVDGPTSKQVDEIIQKYSGGSFDGMTDCYNYSRDPFTAAFGDSKYIFARRDYSPALIGDVIAELALYYAPAVAPSVEDFRSGRAWDVSPIINGHHVHDNWQSLIHEECAKTAR
jgi:hypothetical protein